MKFVLISGMSGAGKSTALKILEDNNYYCVDNLPVPLLPKFAELAMHSSEKLGKTALGIDIRSGKMLAELEQILEDIKSAGIEYEILFLDANDDTLIKRYKETRRRHPLSKNGRVDAGIAAERKKLAFLKRRANYIIDTSRMLTRDLRSEVNKIFIENKEYQNLFINILSFGFKYGIPTDSDLVFDVRFLPNPYYIEELKYKTGNEKEVQDYVLSTETAHEFLDKLKEMILFLIPNYIAEGKNELVISVGCTGGKHRSVTIANGLYERISKEQTYSVKLTHRDIEKDAKRKNNT